MVPMQRLVLPSLFLTLLIAMAATAVPFGVAIATAVTTLFGMTHARRSVLALLVLLYLRMSNPALATPTSGSEVVGIVGLLLCSGRIWVDALVRSGVIANGLPAFTWPYVITITVLSMFASTDPTVSFLKLVSFVIPMGAVILGIHMMMREGRHFTPYAVTFWLFVLLLSIPTLAIPAIGYQRDAMGFQGILNHPQGLAVFLAPVVILTLLQALNPTNGRSRFFLIMFVISIVFLWLTRGRTGFAAILLAFLLLLAFRPGFMRSATTLAGKALSKPWVLAGVLGALALFLLSDISLIDLLDSFIFKGGDDEGLSVAYQSSRGFLIDQAIANFWSSPLTGIGFGISNSFTHAFNVQIDPLTGLPVGAATEKANLVLAVLEETGLIGSIMFVPFIVSVVRRIARTPDLSLAWCAMAALATTMSEMTFFSFGGVGLYVWLMIGWALAEQSYPLQDVGSGVRTVLPASASASQN